MDKGRRSREVDESDPAGLAVENFSCPGCRVFLLCAVIEAGKCLSAFKFLLVHVITRGYSHYLDESRHIRRQSWSRSCECLHHRICPTLPYA